MKSCVNCLYGNEPIEFKGCRACMKSGSNSGWKPDTTGIEAMVCADIAERQKLGLAKYGTTLADNKLELKEWLVHQYQELLDAALYCKRAIVQIENEEKQNGNT